MGLYIALDHFECNDSVCVGELIVVHPRLVRREVYEKEITTKMERWPVPTIEITRQWNAENKIPMANNCATAPKDKL
eukprot:2256091-Ditylum_brightwellii.AAC.1